MVVPSSARSTIWIARLARLWATNGHVRQPLSLPILGVVDRSQRQAPPDSYDSGLAKEKDVMNKLGMFLCAASMGMAIAMSPATAQQSGQGGMMGQGGPGQGKGAMQGGMKGQGKANCPKSMMGKGMMQGGMMHSRPMMEGRLAYIKADLEITDAQTDAWNAYAEAIRARHASMEGMHADMMKAKESGNAVERMDARIKATEAKLESLKALKPATEGLYAVLTDAQKERADKLLGGGCGMM
jgi:LTXXQ motif family protein